LLGRRFRSRECVLAAPRRAERAPYTRSSNVQRRFEPDGAGRSGGNRGESPGHSSGSIAPTRAVRRKPCAKKGRATGKGRERKLSCSRDNHRRRPFTRSCVSTDRRTSQHVLISLRTRETPRTELERHMAMPGLYGVVTTSLLTRVKALLTAEAVSHLK
jgi:hypothetical protein